MTDRTVTMEEFLRIWFDLIATGTSLRLEAWAYRTQNGEHTAPKATWTGPIAIELFAHEFMLKEDELERLLVVVHRHGLSMLIETGDDGHKIGFGQYGSGRFLITRESTTNVSNSPTVTVSSR